VGFSFIRFVRQKFWRRIAMVATGSGEATELKND
jgi:hypothetical protein